MTKRSLRESNAKKKGIASFLAVLSFTAYMPVSCLPSFANISATALPDLNKAVNGDVSTTGNRMDVAVKGGAGTVGQFDWNTFNVGKDAQVNWVFNANSQTALNRVLASGGMSYIYGKLTESSGSGCPSCTNTSKVILINPSGILFGNGSSVNLNSFTASTYDIKGAKNLQDLSDAQLKEYAGTGGTTGGLFNIAGYNKTISFVANDNMVDGNGYITSNSSGTRLASIVADGAEINANKTIAMVGNKIDIANSKLTTTYESTPNASNAKQTRSNVKLVTGDGVNFYYTSAGNADNSVKVAKATKTTNEKYGISVKNSEVRTGNMLAYNGVEGQNGSIDVENSTIYTKKLLGTTYTTTSGAQYDATETGTDGNITITSAGSVNIADSNIQTTNDRVNGKNISTGIGYGNLKISGNDGVTIKNTQLRSADSLKNTDSNNIQAGNITITSSAGNVNLVQDAPTDSVLYDNTAIHAAGDLTIAAAGDVNVDSYNKIQAVGHGTANDASANTERTITVNGTNVNFADTLLNAKNLNVNADKEINVNTTSIVADNTKLLGSDTTIDNSLLQYSDLAFYGDDNTNNVTVKNNTTFYDKDSEGLTLATNGNLTLDNTRLQKKPYGSTGAANQTSVSLESTDGNVVAQNGTKVITSNGDITVKADKGDITVDASTLYATEGSMDLAANNVSVENQSIVWAKNGNVDINASSGKVVAHNSSIAAEGGDTTISQALSMDIDNDFEGSTIGTTNKLTLKSAGDITSNLAIQDGQQLTAGTGYINDYKNLISLNNDSINTHLIFKDALLDAGANIDLNDVASANNVDFVAGNNINLASTVNMDLADVTVNAGGATNIAAAGKLTTDGIDILGGEKTTLSGDTVSTKGNSAINAHSNKLAVNANGAIDINVTGVDNVDKGLEINADINTSQGSDPLAGRTVSVNAQDGTLAISKIKADTLDIFADNILAAKTTITADNDNVSGLVAAGVDMDAKGYIEVKTDGGFNLDATKDYNNGNNDIYTGGNYGTTITNGDTVWGDKYSRDEVVSKDVTTDRIVVGQNETMTEQVVGRQETSRTQIGDPVVSTSREDNVVQDGVTGYTTTTTTTTEYQVKEDVTYKTNINTAYQDQQTTTTTTKTTTYQDYTTNGTVRDNQHIATLNEQQQNGFVLVYGKTTETEKSGTVVVGTDTKTVSDTINVGNVYSEVTGHGTQTVTDGNTWVDTVTDVNTTFCEYEPDIEPDAGLGDEVADVSSWVRIPRHIEGTSDAAPVQNDIADTSSTVVAAAARLQLDGEEAGYSDASYDSSEDDLYDDAE